jgi:hypothetical protein
LVYPNPVKNNLQVQVNVATKEIATLQLIDNSGKMQFTTTANLQQGNNSLNYKMGHLQSGSYMVKVITAKEALTQKIIKVD